MFVYFIIFFSKEVNPSFMKTSGNIKKYKKIFGFFKNVKKKTKFIFGKIKNAKKVF